MFKHIIWDFDGTLFNSYPAMGGAFKVLLKEHGIEESLEEILKYMKVSMGTAIEYYKNNYHIDSTFLDEYDLKRSAIEKELCRPYQGIPEVCKSIHDSGKKSYLYTHRGESAITFLKKYSLYDYFADFITSTNGFERKPSPEAINYLVEKHNMLKDEAIMIGDRELDILSAKNAGIYSCFFSGNGGKCDIADYTIDNFKQLHSIISESN